MAEMLSGVCVLKDLFNIADYQDQIRWQPFRPGVEIHSIYAATNDDGPAAALLRFAPGARVDLHEHRGLEHILVLAGSQVDQNGYLRAGSLMIHAPGTRHSIVSHEGCIVLAIYEERVRFIEEAGTKGNEADDL